MPARLAPGEAAGDGNIKLAKLRERLLKVWLKSLSTIILMRSCSYSCHDQADIICHFSLAGAYHGAG